MNQWTSNPLGNRNPVPKPVIFPDLYYNSLRLFAVKERFGAFCMETAEFVLFTLLGLAGVVYAYISHEFKSSVTDSLPETLRESKVLFAIGFALILAGYASAYAIGPRHGYVTIIGGWIMLVGSAPWFNKRICRKFFAPEELKVIRVTLFSGLIIVIFSTGALYVPPMFSPGTFLMGVSLALLSGRLWWNQDPSLQNQIMQQSKRNYE